jgi:hypothetical protein
MAETLEVRPAHTLTSKEIKQLQSLSMRERGCMAYDVMHYRWDARTHVLTIKDETGKLLAWALVYKSYGQKYEIQLYTRKTERRKGFATMLYAEADKRWATKRRKMRTFPHDEKSTRFFKKVKAIR